MTRMNITPAELEDVATARTATCPICAAAPDKRCTGEGVNDNGVIHVGRLKAAVPPPRTGRFAWLDWHDAYLANPNAPAEHRAEILAFAGQHHLEVTRERRTR